MEEKVTEFKILTTEESQAYETLQNASGIEVGDTVKMVRLAKSYELGWRNSWQESMNNSLGKEFKVTSIRGECGINLGDPSCCDYPFFVFEIVKKWNKEDESLKKVKTNLISYAYNLIRNLTSITKKLEGVKTPEEFTSVKKELMLEQANLMLSNNTCYYCVDTDVKCEKCFYGKIHSPCTNEGSTYKEIEDARNALLKALKKY